MQALYKIGTEEKYRKEILSSGLVGCIDTQYAQALLKLGDKSIQDPWFPEHSWLDLGNFNHIFDSLPLLFYSWSAVYNPSGFSLSGVVRMQQTSSAVRAAVQTMVSRLKSISNLSNNIATLYEVLAFESGIVDGDVSYPDEAHIHQNGMAIEFKRVNFGYPSAPNKVLKDLSFKIEPGQLCVIVGENRCGKSTTVNLINRLYECDSGEIYIDGRPIKDYKVSTIRTAVNIVYQSYVYFPLTIKENFLMGHHNPMNPDKHVETIENAAKLGGSYDFVQKLPLKFETNLEPLKTGWSSSDCRVVDWEIFKRLAVTERNTGLSGGQWQRLAASESESFMKNSESTRLLCYDEPSASLDPKAEALFERLRNLRGEKTMVFGTHRFGHLTKHADLIIHIEGGSVIEQGTHKSLLAEGGEYAKMCNLQSQAFVDCEMEDALNVLVAIAAIYFAYRWLSRDTGGAHAGGNVRPATVLGFAPKNVTPEMIASVRSAFPQESIDNIRYDLLKSGSVEITSNKILERGYLDRPPPAYFTLYPPTPAADVTTTDTPAAPATTSAPAKNTSLISRYGLENRAKEESATEFSDKAAWEDSAAKREASLKERKAQMILAARQRMLAQQSQVQSQSTS
ncbi:unnamed protein product [Rhizoctonia solani]|uniref:ABC transporter domain-containing protein n=1 Tax=Rhizoctonia solani TaxID=456999 RepID=A0A8H3HEW3_9AGAM|nr:unnamed protein product [Rhizoctonia solani]